MSQTFLQQIENLRFSDQKINTAASEITEEVKKVLNLIQKNESLKQTFHSNYLSVLGTHQRGVINQLKGMQGEANFCCEKIEANNTMVIQQLNNMKNCMNEMSPLNSDSQQALEKLSLKEDILKKCYDPIDQQIRQYQYQLSEIENKKSLLETKYSGIQLEMKSNIEYIYLDKQIFTSTQKQIKLEQLLQISKLKSTQLSNKKQAISMEIETMTNQYGVLQKQFQENEKEIKIIQEEQKKIQQEISRSLMQAQQMQSFQSDRFNSIVPLVIVDSENFKSFDKDIPEKLRQQKYIQENQVFKFQLYAKSYVSSNYKEGINSIIDKLEKSIKELKDYQKLNCLLIVNSPPSVYVDSTALSLIQDLSKFIKTVSKKLFLTIYDSSPQVERLFEKIKDHNKFEDNNIQYFPSHINQDFTQQISALIVKQFIGNDKPFTYKANNPEAQIKLEQEKANQLALCLKQKQDDNMNHNIKIQQSQQDKERLQEILEVEQQIAQYQEDKNRFISDYKEKQQKIISQEKAELDKQINDLKNSISRLEQEKGRIELLLNLISKLDCQKKIKKLIEFRDVLPKEMDLLFSFIWAYSGQSSLLLLNYGVYKQNPDLKLDEKDYINMSRQLSITYKQAEDLLRQIKVTITENQTNFAINLVEQSNDAEVQVNNFKKLISRDILSFISKIKTYPTNKDMLNSIEQHIQTISPTKK